jgi:hypothetical protein
MATGTHDGYDPEATLAQMRGARETRPLIRDVAPIVDRSVAQARHLWADPAEREAAGFGCLTAAANFAEVAQDGPQAMMLNLVGLFGQSLVDDARAEMRAKT